MATPAQITANRLNAQKSTGPSSAEGKAASRFNALKHAASAQSLVIPGEDEAAFAELTRSYHEQFHPVGPEEQLLVEKIIASDWTQRRMNRLEAQVTNALIDHQDPDDPNPLGRAFIEDCRGANALQKIFRRREAASRDWYRALAHLRQLQFDRMAFPPPPPAVADRASAPVPIRAAVPPPNSTPQALDLHPTTKIGFVFDESTPPAWRL